MNICIILILGISLSLDIICTYLATVTPSVLSVVDCIMLGVQAGVLLYNSILIILLFLKLNSSFRLILYETFLRIFVNIFYGIVSLEKISNISSIFYILSYSNFVFLLLKLYSTEYIQLINNRVYPTMIIKIESERIEDTEEICSICLEQLKYTEVYKTKCGHMFHIECIKNYININNFTEVNCPNCRQEILSNRL